MLDLYYILHRYIIAIVTSDSYIGGLSVGERKNINENFGIQFGLQNLSDTLTTELATGTHSILAEYYFNKILCSTVLIEPKLDCHMNIPRLMITTMHYMKQQEFYGTCTCIAPLPYTI